MKGIIFILVFIQVLYMSDAHAQNFSPLPPGFNSEVRSLFYDSTSNVLYAGGAFSKLADNVITMQHISRWNGSMWDSLGPGLFGNVYAITKYNGFIYAGGSFAIKDSLGNYILQANISYWDGSHWNLPPGGVFANSAVWSLFVNGNDLFVGGSFDSINGIPAQGLARFDGTQWYSYPALDPVYTSYVFDIAIFNNELYVAGNFNAGPGLKDIVKFDGTNWVTVGGGLSGNSTSVGVMLVHQGELYVVGDFHVSTGDPGNCIAKWNGSTWSSLGIGLPGGQLFAMTSFNNQIYVGGFFNSIGGISATHLARWDGFNWNSLGSTFNNGVEYFASHGNDLYIGGGFWTIDGDSNMRITRYSPPLGIEGNSWKTKGITITPNPNNGNFTLSSLFYPIESFWLFDLSGSVVFSNGKILSNSYQCKLNSPDGIYIAEVFINGNAYRSKILLMH